MLEISKEKRVCVVCVKLTDEELLRLTAYREVMQSELAKDVHVTLSMAVRRALLKGLINVTPKP